MNTYLDGRREPAERRLSRFLVFGIVVVLAMGGLTARLFYLQIVNGGQFTALAAANRTVIESIPSTRGLIYDRAGRPLVTNVPMFAVKIRPADLPVDFRPEVVDRLAAMIGIDPAEINAAIDSNPGSSFDLVRIADDIDENTARLISESSIQLPGVEIAVEARREYPDGPLMSQIVGYTGPVSPQQLPDLRAKGYLPDDLLGKAGVESSYESYLRGVYGTELVERNARGQRTQVLSTETTGRPGNSLRLTIDTKIQKEAEKALKWGIKSIGNKRGVFIVMNPQTGEVLAMVSLPTYDNNLFARGISNKDFQKLVKNKDLPLLNHAVQAHYPPGSTYKLVAGTGALADKKVSATTKSRDQGVPDGRRDEVLRLEPTRIRSLRHLLRLRPLERHLLLHARWHARDRPPGLLGEPVRVRRSDRRRSTRRGLRDRADQRLEAGRKGRPDLHRRDVPGEHRAGLRQRHATPAHQRVRRAGERRKALPAAGRARGRRPRRRRWFDRSSRS